MALDDFYKNLDEKDRQSWVNSTYTQNNQPYVTSTDTPDKTFGLNPGSINDQIGRNTQAFNPMGRTSNFEPSPNRTPQNQFGMSSGDIASQINKQNNQSNISQPQNKTLSDIASSPYQQSSVSDLPIMQMVGSGGLQQNALSSSQSQPQQDTRYPITNQPKQEVGLPWITGDWAVTRSKMWSDRMGQGDIDLVNRHSFFGTPNGQKWLGSDAGKSWLDTEEGKNYLKSNQTLYGMATNQTQNTPSPKTPNSIQSPLPSSGNSVQEIRGTTSFNNNMSDTDGLWKSTYTDESGKPMTYADRQNQLERQAALWAFERATNPNYFTRELQRPGGYQQISEAKYDRHGRVVAPAEYQYIEPVYKTIYGDQAAMEGLRAAGGMHGFQTPSSSTREQAEANKENVAASLAPGLAASGNAERYAQANLHNVNARLAPKELEQKSLYQKGMLDYYNKNSQAKYGGDDTLSDEDYADKLRLKLAGQFNAEDLVKQAIAERQRRRLPQPNADKHSTP